ncbi:ST5 isoform 3 [Pongo abelii]|uniref:ST5 isoform 3 n=1 Tax=Pongo abelii TaxID=9601 RepID=A0A2J8SV52_PONAB|nr:ST5 isoform 3 [Pongo abelii]
MKKERSPPSSPSLNRWLDEQLSGTSLSQKTTGRDTHKNEGEEQETGRHEMKETGDSTWRRSLAASRR